MSPAPVFNSRLDSSAERQQAQDLLAALENGQLQPAYQAFDLPAQLHQLMQAWQPHAEARQLRLNLDMDGDTPRWVRSDPNLLAHLLNNLVRNALAFTFAGSVDLAVDTMGLQTFDQGEPTTMLRLALQDTGIGMSPPQRALRAELGVGLKLCKQLIALLGGEITIHSTPGEGSCVTLILPCQVCVPPQPAADAECLPGNGRRVLVVDDNDTNLKVAVTILERLGYQTRTAINGIEAVTAVQGREKFDLVLMDCHMPIVDGVQATRSIRAWEVLTQRPPLPIIAVSASTFVEDRERCRDAGMNDFVPKPITLASIRTAVEKWFPAAETFNLDPGINASLDCLPVSLFAHVQFGEMADLAGPKFAELLQRFLEDAARQVVNMQVAASLQDGEAVRRCAHKLKGSSASLGAHALSSLCERVETLGKQQQLQHIATEIDAIAQCLQASRASIALYLNQLT